MCVLFSPCPFFPLGFWDGVFSEAHMCRLQRMFLAIGVRIVNVPVLTWSATRSRCAGRDRITEGLLLGVRPRQSPKVKNPHRVKEAKLESLRANL
jgi:hypothetical protein